MRHALQRFQSVAYTPEEGQLAARAFTVCLEQLDALVQRLVGVSCMPLFQ